MAEAVNQRRRGRARVVPPPAVFPLQPGRPIPRRAGAAKTVARVHRRDEGSSRGPGATTHDRVPGRRQDRQRAHVRHLTIKTRRRRRVHHRPGDTKPASTATSTRRSSADACPSTRDVQPVRRSRPIRTEEEMKYRLFFTAADGRPITLSGFKDVEGPAFTDALDGRRRRSTRRCPEGHVVAGGESNAIVIGRGIIRISFFQFLQQLTRSACKGPTRRRGSKRSPASACSFSASSGTSTASSCRPGRS